MNKKKIISALSALALIFATAKSTSITANAASTVTGGTITFATYLTMDKEAYVPSATFDYTVEPYGDRVAQYTTGTPTIGSAVFTQGQATFDAVAAKDSKITINNNTASNGTNDALTLSTGKKYARAAVTVDFSTVKFNELGTYYYLIQQKSGTEPSLTYDQTPMIMMVDVQYVSDSNGLVYENGEPKRAIDAYIMYQATATTTNGTTTYTINDGTNGTTKKKADGFVNDYDTENLTISKTVSGNQSSHDEYFQFDLTIMGGQPGIIYTVDLGNADPSTKVNGASNVAHTNVSSLTVDSTKSAQATFWLHHNQSIVIKGIAKGTMYTVSENYATVVTKEGYTPSVAIAGDTLNGNQNTLTSGTYTASDTANGKNVTNTLTLNDDKTATYAYTDTVTPANSKSLTTGGTWVQNASTITVNFKISDTETQQIVYQMSVDGKTLTVAGTPTLTSAYMPTLTSASPVITVDAANTAIAMDAATTKVTDAFITADTTVAYTNAKAGTIPTGIILNTAPYAIVVLAGFCGLIIFAKKRREEAEED